MQLCRAAVTIVAVHTKHVKRKQNLINNAKNPSDGGNVHCSVLLDLCPASIWGKEAQQQSSERVGRLKKTSKVQRMNLLSTASEVEPVGTS